MNRASDDRQNENIDIKEIEMEEKLWNSFVAERLNCHFVDAMDVRLS